MTTSFQLQSHKVVSVSAFHLLHDAQCWVPSPVSSSALAGNFKPVNLTLSMKHLPLMLKKINKAQRNGCGYFSSRYSTAREHSPPPGVSFAISNEEKRRLIYWHLLAKILACSKGRKTLSCSDILLLAKNRLVTKIQLTMFSIYLESLLTVHSATTSKFMTSPMYIPQGMTALHSQECP